MLSTLLLTTITALLPVAPLPKEDILGKADERIEQYRKADARLRLLGPGGSPISGGARVRIEQTRHAFLFGCNIFKLDSCKTPENNKAYADQFAGLLNYATLPFYWWGYEKQEHKPDHTKTAKLLDWCEAHNVATKGHPLAWNYVDPGWLPDDPDKVQQLQMQRITREVTRFKGRMQYWDVVNEATHYDRESLLKKQAPRLSAMIGKIGIGEYVREAFQAARKADPKAVLIINDYVTDQSYAEKVISKLVDDRGKPMYDVIGIQSHQHGGAWPVEKIWEVCERFAAFGKPLHFTETTFVSGEQGWELTEKKKEPTFKWASTPEGEQRQKRDVSQFYTVLFSHPAVEAVTWWDLTDQHAWQQAPAGLLREDMTPKPAYDALKALIKGKWWTTTEATVGGAQGEAGFRGFRGGYKVTVEVNGKQLTGTFLLDGREREPIKVQLK